MGERSESDDRELTEALLAQLRRGSSEEPVVLKAPERALLAEQLRSRSVPDAAKRELLEATALLALSRRSHRDLLDPIVRTALELGETEKALARYRSVTRGVPHDLELRRLLARALQGCGQHRDAVEIARAVLRREPGDLDCLEISASSLMHLGRGREAVELLDRAELEPRTTSTHRELELILLRERAARETKHPLEHMRPDRLRTVIECAEERGANDLLARAAWALGLDADRRGDRDGALSYMDRAREARIAEGDAFRCAEVENSQGILWHRKGASDRAISVFDTAIQRLEQLGSDQALQAIGIVELNRADVLMDLQRFEEAARDLDSLGARFGQGVQSIRCELIRLEALARLGAAPDLVGAELEQLRPTLEKVQSPTLASYFHRMLAWLARNRGDYQGARRETELEVAHGEARDEAAVWAEARTRLAALQDDVPAARRILAATLWERRREADPLLHFAVDIVQRREPALPQALPLVVTQHQELARDLRRLLEVQSPAMPAPISPELWTRLCQLMARGMEVLEPGALASFLEEEMGADAFVLRLRDETGRWHEERVAGSIDPDETFRVESELPDSERERPHSLAACGFASLSFHRDPSDRCRLTLANSRVAMRFGLRESLLARTLCAGFAAGARVGETRAPAAPAEVPTRAHPVTKDTVPILGGSSRPIRALRDNLQQLSESGLTIAISGETGSGKTRAARYAHAVGPRNRLRLQTIHVAELTEGLAHSQLLGHASGAYTGASQDRVGLLEAASGGSVLLEGIEGLDAKMQLLLARTLERKRLRRLGETKERPLDVRLLVTTEHTLEDCLARGTLRPELVYALAAGEVRVPPLRERLEDLDALVMDLMREAGRPPRRMPGATLRSLAKEPWPGNVRELEGRVRRSLAMTGKLQDYFEALAESRERTAPSQTLAAAVRAYEAELVRRALARHGGHRERAAAELGISRRWLSEKITRFGLDRALRDEE